MDFIYAIDQNVLMTRAGIAIILFLFFILLRNVLTNFVFWVVLKISKRSNYKIDREFLNSFLKPLRALLVTVGLYISLRYFFTDASYEMMVSKAFRSLLIFFVTWGLFNLADTCSDLFQRIIHKYEFDNDKIVFPFISKIIRFIIVALAFTIILQEWGFNIQGFIAGIGLGGLAFALAAQDTLANVFGGVVIITEKPFRMGDWIETPSVEGTVEDLSFRSTRVRTFAQGLVTVPNATLAKEPITNWSKMGVRRVTFNLGVMYSTPAYKLEKVVHRIKDMLKNDPEIDQELIFVTFDKFSDSSYDLFLYYFTKTTSWGAFLEVKQKINFNIIKILEEEEVTVAFPSTSVYFENQIPNPESHKNTIKNEV